MRPRNGARLAYDRAVTSATPSGAAPKRAPRTLSEPAGAVLLMALPAACATWLLLVPRVMEPRALPALTLSADAVALTLERDRKAAATASHTALADNLRALLMTQGEAEVRGLEDATDYQHRRAELAKQHAALVAAEGEAASNALRAEAMQQLDAALELRLPRDRARNVLGALPNMLARDHAAHEGTLIAPRFVVRTLYKARWNLLFGLRPEHGFSAVERQAFFGFQALHAERLPIVKRAEALREYARAGGAHADEALGVLLYRSGDFKQAMTVLDAVAEAEGNVRVRNYALAAHRALERANADDAEGP